VEEYAQSTTRRAYRLHGPSARSFIERKTPGAAYVYFNYGMTLDVERLVKGVDNGFRPDSRAGATKASNK